MVKTLSEIIALANRAIFEEKKKVFWTYKGKKKELYLPCKELRYKKNFSVEIDGVLYEC